MSGAAAGLVLAAGLALRFGADKLGAGLRGRPLLQHVLDTAAEAALSPLVVVTGMERGGIDWRGARRVVNKQPEQGVSSSLRWGLAALRDAGDAERVVVMLGDQPLASPVVIARLLQQPRDGTRPITVPVYADGQPGNPVLLERAAWSLATQLTGDEGMRQLFAARPDLIRYVDVPGTNPDVDTPADLLALDERGR